MPQVIDFFERQTLSSGDNQRTFYSEIFDVSQYTELVAELRLYSIPTGLTMITGVIETCFDSSFADGYWTELGDRFFGNAVGGTSGVRSDPCRFVRGKITVPPDRNVILCFQAVAREGT